MPTCSTTISPIWPDGGADRRLDGRASPWRASSAFTTNPPACSCWAAPSITLSPIASGGRSRRSAAWSVTQASTATVAAVVARRPRCTRRASIALQALAVDDRDRRWIDGDRRVGSLVGDGGVDRGRRASFNHSRPPATNATDIAATASARRCGGCPSSPHPGAVVMDHSSRLSIRVSMRSSSWSPAAARRSSRRVMTGLRAGCAAGRGRGGHGS